MQMIEVDNVWQLKTFEAVLTDLRRRWDERSQKQKDISMHFTENSKTNDEMEGIEAFDLCNENQTKNSEFHERKESTKQERRRIKMKNKTIARTESKNRQGKGKPMAESEENKTVMMCWEKLKDSPGKEPHEEPENEGEKSIKKMQNSKDEEEQVDSTLYTGNQPKISIEEFSWETEDDGSTLETQGTKQHQLVYITNLEDDLQKNGTKLYEEEGPKDKKRAAKIGFSKACPK